MLNVRNVENGSIAIVYNQTSLMGYFYVQNALGQIIQNLWLKKNERMIWSYY